MLSNFAHAGPGTGQSLPPRQAMNVEKGGLSKQTKLTGREEDIEELLKNKVSGSAIARIMKVKRVTLPKFVDSRGLRNIA